MPGHDAIVIGSGPNGLAAAITLAQEGLSVLVLERSSRLGGGLRSEELTLPGFIHDSCSAIHPLARASPFFQALKLERHGVRFIQPEISVAHPLDHGEAVLHFPSVGTTAANLGPDQAGYAATMQHLVDSWSHLLPELLSPPLRFPRSPVLMAHFGMHALRSARSFAQGRFVGVRARALFAGHAAHSCVALEKAGTASFGLVLGLSAHAVGWPLIAGGTQKLADALATRLRELGGTIQAGVEVTDLRALSAARAVFCDVTPRQFAALAGPKLAPGQAARYRRFRYGPGVFKVDWALSQPIPWRNPDCRRTATVHLGGTFDEVAAAEAAAWNGRLPDRPFVLLAQQSLFDPSRAPAERHTAWGYCHVPNGATVDMTAAIEAQVERFAPGFRDVILARHTRGPVQLEAQNPNLVGGDIAGGANDLRQLLVRPVLQSCPYATPVPNVYLCSASTPPGGGVHGMGGFHAAQAALRRTYHIPARPLTA